MKNPVKRFLPIFIGLFSFTTFATADTLDTYGDTTVVTGPDSNPAWQLSSFLATGSYSGLELAVTGPLTPATLTQLSADYVMTLGTFGGGAPRFTIFHYDAGTDSYTSAYLYWGTPLGGGTFVDPNIGNTSYANTGNYADTSSGALRVESNGFGGDNGQNTYVSWSQFLAANNVAGTQIDYITLDLDAGFGGDQTMDTTRFNVNGTIYTPQAVPEPSTYALLGLALTFLFLARKKLQKRKACH